MDYTIRYGLEFNPFLKNSKEIFISTDESKEVLFRLNYLAKTKGFGLLTGSPGRGKTTAIRAWRQGLNNSQYKVVYTCFPPLVPMISIGILLPNWGHRPTTGNRTTSVQSRKNLPGFLLKKGKRLSSSLMRRITSVPLS